MIISETAECANEWEQTPKGEDAMCRLVEEYAKEREKEGSMNTSIEIALNLLKAGRTVTFTSQITKLASDFVEQLAIDNNISYTI